MDALKYNPIYDFFRDIYYKRTGQDVPIHTLPYNTTSTTGLTGAYFYPTGVTMGYIPHGVGGIGSTSFYGVTGATTPTGTSAYHGNCGDPYCQSCSDLKHRVLTTGSNKTNIVTVNV